MNAVLYTVSWKSYDRRMILDFLDKNNIEYKEYDLSNNKQALDAFIKKNGSSDSLSSFPVVEIGRKLIHGFDLKQLKNAIRKRKGLERRKT